MEFGTLQATEIKMFLDASGKIGLVLCVVQVGCTDNGVKTF